MSYTHLFESTKPENYQISLDIDPSESVITFSETISCSSRVKGRLLFHAKYLSINEVLVNGKGAEFSFNTKDETIEITSKEIIPDSTLAVSIIGEAPIQENLNGAYRSPNPAGTDIISTQMETHHCRELFVCVDEPSAKATFNVEITAPSDLTVLANGAELSKETQKEKTTYRFEQTPKMSTYLFAFVVGELESLSAKTKRGITVRTFSQPAKTAHTAFALEVAVKCLDFFEGYFGIEYPLDKCDMVAVPEFSAGAMENWGLVTYRETALLYNKNESSLPAKQRVAIVVAHELAHQWFGNLVTMSWWTDLWLNEGFASWIEYLAVDHIFPEWKMWEEFTREDMQRAKSLDSLHNSHPIEVPIDHADEVRSIFDMISYAKGASVIHMLHSYMGAEDFREGIQHYLTKHSYENTTTKDLWSALTEKSGRDIVSFMDTWTSKTGFPVVALEGKEATQQRFLMLSDETTDDGTLWPIPLIDRSGSVKLMKKKTTILEETDSLYNLEGSSLALFRYDDVRFKTIIEAVKKGDLSSYQISELLNQQNMLAKGCRGSIVDALDILFAVPQDRLRHEVFESAGGMLGSLKHIFSEISSDGAKKIRGIADTLSRERFKELLEVKDLDHFQRLEKMELFSLQSFSRSSNFDDLAKSILDGLDDSESLVKIDPDIRGSVLSYLVKKGDPELYERLLSEYGETENPQFNVQLIGLLTGFEDDELIKRSLALIKSEKAKLQDVVYWIAYLASNPVAKKPLWLWVQDEWGWLIEKFGTDIMSLAEMPKYLARSFIGKSKAGTIEEYLEFFTNLAVYPQIRRQVHQGEESIRIAQNWLENDKASVKRFLDQIPAQD